MFTTPRIIWIKRNLNHIDTRALLPRYQDPCIGQSPEWFRKSSNTQTTEIKKSGILIEDTRMVSENR